MKINHIAIWVNDLERMGSFYMKYFDMTSGEKYTNTRKQFSSYFLSFPNSSARIEIMTRPDITGWSKQRSTEFGFTHVALSVGSKEKVNQLTERLRRDGFKVIGEPRTTGDGYYESVVEDCEQNQIEITV